ncbi:MAG: glycosyltransferase [Anaerolineales bacterium]|nr:glycosyltransferase [Anaerolineales bacterium]
MRILIVTDLYPPHVNGGYELRCKETADELSRRGHDIFILTSRQGGESSQIQGNIYRLLFFNTTTNLDKLTIKDPFRLRRRYYQFQWAFKSRKNYQITAKLIATIQPDLVFIWNMGNISPTPILAAQDFSIPTVFSIGDYWLLSLKAELSDDTNYIKKKFRAMITGLGDFSQLELSNLLPNSIVLKNTYIENGFPEKNFHVISRGVQANLILSTKALGKMPRDRNGHMKLLFVGRLHPNKAPDVAINALDNLSTEYGLCDIKLDIVGQGSKEYISSLKNLVFKLKLEKNVRFVGWLDHSAVLDLYSDYDALLFPSRWVEPLGGTVLEAMARGLPVIASRRGGPLEIINDGENGLLVSVDDPAAFSAAIMKLLQSDELTQKIRIAGINTIHERYTLEHIVDQNLEYFQRVLVASNINKTQERI